MILLRTASLLIISNVFMTFAWYGHLRNLNDRKWYIAVALSWGIALFEYMFMIPANRIGATELSLSQLKILQEAITLLVFVPFAVIYMRQSPRLDFVWAGLLILGAVFFMFRGQPLHGSRPETHAATVRSGAVVGAMRNSDGPNLRVLPERPHRVTEHHDPAGEDRPLHTDDARHRSGDK